MTKNRELNEGPNSEQTKKLQGCAIAIWQEIASDVFAAFEGAGEKTPDSIPRAHVIELVLDAGRFEDEVEKKVPEMLAWVQGASYATLQKLVKPAFPYGRYS